MSRVAVLTATALVACSFGPVVAEEAADAAVPLGERVAKLLDELDADSAAARRAAESALVELAGDATASAERLLRELPEADDRMPPSVRSGLGRVRKRVERRLAEAATAASTVTIDADGETIAAVLRQIAEQTGNKIRDDRESYGEDDGAGQTRVDFTASDEPFWPAVDRLLDEAGLSVYPYGGAGELALVGRGQNEGDRFGAATYAGPFRFEPLRVVATRGVRNAAEESLDVDLEIAWEPRIRPIALSQPLADLEVLADDGGRLRPARPEQNLDVEVTPGSQAVELRVALALPDRSTRSIASLKGRMTALAPGRMASFKIDDVGAQSGAVSRRRGDATVTLERFFRNNAIWELRMRMRLERAGDALASHRGWVFQNTSYLEDAEGRRIEHAGFETTMQTESEVGLAYFFDFADEEAAAGDAFDPRRLSWVYETPAGIVELPVEYELTDIALP